MCEIKIIIVYIASFLAVISESSILDLCGVNDTYIDSYQEDTSTNCGCENYCIRKCCKMGYFLGHNRTCHASNFSSDFTVPVYKHKTSFDKNVRTKDNFVIGIINCTFFLLNNSSPDDIFFVQDNGFLWSPLFEIFYQNNEYCVDEADGLSAFLCFGDEEGGIDETARKIYAVGMIISMPFLFATLLVYALLPDRNLHQKALMFYVLSLLLAYIFLVTIQLSTIQFEETKCQFLGFSAMFCFMVSFFWMNVICLDIWFTFSGSRGLVGSRRDSERRRFLWYCLYALGIPVLHITVVILINAYGDQEADYIPGVGMGMCFVRDGLPSFLYLYLPMGLLITANIVLFACTAFKIRQVKKETSMLKQNDSKRHSYEKDKQKFNLYLKLLLAMGVNWSMEVISFAVIWKMGKNLPHYIWYLTDICNALYGVFIFFIFVFKKKIWKLLQKRYYVFIGKPQLAHSLTTTATTRASNYSSGNSTADTTLTDARSHVGTNGVRSEEIALTRR